MDYERKTKKQLLAELDQARLKVSSLEQSEAELNAVLNNSPLLILIMDRKRRVTRANENVLEATGWTMKEALGRRGGEVIRCLNSMSDPGGCGYGHACKTCKLRLTVEETFKYSSGRQLVEVRLPLQIGDKKGRETCLLVSTAPLETKDGKRVIVIVQDVTEMKAAETEVEAREKYFRSLIHNLHEDILVIDRDYVVTDVNNSTLITTGHLREQMIGRRCYEMSHGHDGPCRDYGEICPLPEVFETGESRQCRHFHLDAKGGKVYVDILLSPVKDGDGKVVRVVEACRDITSTALAEKELQLKNTVFEASIAANSIADPEGRITNANQAFLRMWGYRQQSEVRGLSIAEFFMNREDTTDILETLNTTGEWAGEFQAKRRDGSSFTAQAFSTVVLDRDGKLIGYQATCIDATQQKLAEEGLQRSEARYRSLIDNLEEIIFTIDLGGRVTFASRSTERILGYTRKEAVGMNILEFLPVEERKRAIETLPKGMKGKKISHYQTKAIAKSGKRVILDLTFSRLYEEGSVVGALAVARDITESKQTEDAFRQSEERFRLFAETVEDVFWISRPGLTEIIYVSPAYERVWERPLWDFSADPTKFLEGLHPDDRPLLVKCFEEYHSNHKEYECEYRILTPSGEQKWILERGYPVGGVQDLMAGICTDITERKALEDQLRQSQKMEAIGRLAGGVAHDFNNALTPIMVISDILLNKLPADDLVRQDLQEIREAGERCANLTRQLLAFGRRQTMEMRVLNLNPVIANLEKMLSRVIGEDIELVKFLDPGLGNIKADAGQIEQIIVNLAVNARDAMPRGGKLTIETANVTLDEEYAAEHVAVKPGDYVMMAISDTGEGMDEPVRAHVFEPFFTTKAKGKGSGLGLSTAYGIVKQSEGNIWCYSEPGRGAVFKIYLPRVMEEAQAIGRRRTDAGSQTGTETILLVEDEANVRRAARRILETNGYKVLEADSGERALEVFTEASETIALVVTDVVMPGMSGKETVKKIQALRPGTKALYISGYADNAIVHHGVLEPGTHFIQKPFSSESLGAKVREVLDG